MTENTFIYPANRTTDGCTNLLLIDQAVRDTQVFVSSANAATYPIIYSPQSSKTELRTFLQNNFQTIDRIGLVFETSRGSSRPFFLDGQPFFNQADITYLAENIQTAYSENVTFLINLLKDFHVANIDYLACNTLNYPNWVNYYAILTQETNNSVVIGASNDETGNIKYGGDWVMENTSENIELIYFNESIAYYTYLLGPTSSHTIVIKGGWELYGCGDNAYGSLGLGNITSPITTLTKITLIKETVGGTDVSISSKTPVVVSCGIYTIVLMSDRTLYGCGYNGLGSLGLGNITSPITTLTKITLIREIVGGTNVSISSKTPIAVFCTYSHTIVLMSDGTLYSCGWNEYGQLGLGAGAGTGSQTILTKITLRREAVGGNNVSISGKTPVAVSGGYYYTIVLMSDGTLYGCGNNFYGELGLGFGSYSENTLTKITLIRETVGGTDVSISSKTPVDVSCGAEHTLVFMSDGTLYCCGESYKGQLGLGITGPGTSILTKITLIRETVGGTDVSISSKTPIDVSCGGDHTLVLMSDGTLYICGYNFYGQLGLGNTATGPSTLTKITLIRETVGGTDVSISSKTPIAVSCGFEHTLVLMSDGTLYGCGNNASGQLGLGNTTSPITTLTKIPITNISALMDMTEEQPPAPITNICFPAGTPVKTDQGIIEIQKINPDHHTIGLKIIKAITQTLSEDPDLICFEKDALYKDVPSEKTVMSMNHGVLFKGKWYKAQDMIGVVGEKCTSNKIYRIPYKKGTILYNVLLETHSHMLINNLIVETLNPLNEMVPLYNYFNTMKPSLLLQKACIKLFNRSKKARQTRQKALMAN